jgi:hypothetical protein
LSVTRFVNVLQEYKLLKEILLDEDQRTLFEISTRRLHLRRETFIEPEVVPVRIGLDRTNKLYKDVEEKTVKEYCELYRSWVAVKNSQEESELSKLLLRQVNQDIIVLFEEIYRHIGDDFDRVYEFCIESLKKFAMREMRG